MWDFFLTKICFVREQLLESQILLRHFALWSCVTDIILFNFHFIFGTYNSICFRTFVQIQKTMKAIKQIIDVKNHTFSVVLPKDFTAKRVEVIILPSYPEDDVPQWQQEESERRYNEYLQNPEIAILNEDFMKKLDVL